jgi:hypothetical protein
MTRCQRTVIPAPFDLHGGDVQPGDGKPAIYEETGGGHTGPAAEVQDLGSGSEKGPELVKPRLVGRGRESLIVAIAPRDDVVASADKFPLPLWGFIKGRRRSIAAFSMHCVAVCRLTRPPAMEDSHTCH